jgi:phytanoyl-CoA hydroxylase
MVFVPSAGPGRAQTSRRSTEGHSAPYPAAANSLAVSAYYAEHGYVVLRNCIASAVCDQARAAFEAEVKPYPGFLYRQASADPERHVFTAHGHMLNSLVNIQDLPSSRFRRFKDNGLGILTAPELVGTLEAILGEPPTIVQTMYFEGNPVTWAHQDTYYLDSTELGRMTAAWVALEDIAPGAGRFFIYPGSHRIQMPRNSGEISVAYGHHKYKELVLEVIRRHGLECRAPALLKGDVLLWNSRTIHGSLATQEPSQSRSSLTAHYIPRSTGLMQFQARRRRMRLRTINGTRVHCPKNLDRVDNRAVFFVETRFPCLFRSLKRLAIKTMTR